MENFAISLQKKLSAFDDQYSIMLKEVLADYLANPDQDLAAKIVQIPKPSGFIGLRNLYDFPINALISEILYPAETKS